MIGIIVGLAVFTAILVVLIKDHKEHPDIKVDFFDVSLLFLVSLLVGVIVDGVVFVTYSFAGFKTTTSAQIVETQEIVALQDGTTTSGSFFLGSGRVDNESIYSFYIETENGYKLEILDAQSSTNPVYIKYISSAADTPHIDRYALVEKKTFKNSINPLWFSVFARVNYGKAKAGKTVNEETTSPSIFFGSDEHYDNFKSVIYIPEGSIKQDFVIDME